jgi:hypothetical protein
VRLRACARARLEGSLLALLAAHPRKELLGQEKKKREKEKAKRKKKNRSALRHVWRYKRRREGR